VGGFWKGTGLRVHRRGKGRRRGVSWTVGGGGKAKGGTFGRVKWGELGERKKKACTGKEIGSWLEGCNWKNCEALKELKKGTPQYGGRPLVTFWRTRGVRSGEGGRGFRKVPGKRGFVE